MGLTFERKYFIKDLLNADSLTKNSGIIEFDSFNTFVKVCIKDKKFDLNNSGILIIPVENANEVKSLLQLDVNSRPRISIYLKDFSVETLKAFDYLNGKTNKINLICYPDEIIHLKETLVQNNIPEFISFLGSCAHTFRDNITIEDIDNISYKYTDPYLTLPCFCEANILWDFKSFENLPLKDLSAIKFHISLLNSFISQSNSNPKSFIFSKYAKGNGKFSTYRYSIAQLFNIKRIFISKDWLYLDNIDSPHKINMYDKTADDATEMSSEEISKIRSAFDVKLPLRGEGSYRSLGSISQNIACMQCPSMTPYLENLINNWIVGGNV